jgi:hypothetical protein
VVNALLIDTDEKWEQLQVSFASLPEIHQMYLMVASGAADIPATRLLGREPAGQNSLTLARETSEAMDCPTSAASRMASYTGCSTLSPHASGACSRSGYSSPTMRTTRLGWMYIVEPGS